MARQPNLDFHYHKPQGSGTQLSQTRSCVSCVTGTMKPLQSSSKRPTICLRNCSKLLRRNNESKQLLVRIAPGRTFLVVFSWPSVLSGLGRQGKAGLALWCGILYCSVFRSLLGLSTPAGSSQKTQKFFILLPKARGKVVKITIHCYSFSSSSFIFIIGRERIRSSLMLFAFVSCLHYRLFIWPLRLSIFCLFLLFILSWFSCLLGIYRYYVVH